MAEQVTNDYSHVVVDVDAHLSLSIQIDKLPHLMVQNVRDILAIHSSYDLPSSFRIEFVLKHNKITTEYEDRGLWEHILKQLKQLLWT